MKELYLHLTDEKNRSDLFISPATILVWAITRPGLFFQPLLCNRSSLALVLRLNMSRSLLLEIFSLILSSVCSEDCCVPHH